MYWAGSNFLHLSVKWKLPQKKIFSPWHALQSFSKSWKALWNAIGHTWKHRGKEQSYDTKIWSCDLRNDPFLFKWKKKSILFLLNFLNIFHKVATISPSWGTGEDKKWISVLYILSTVYILSSCCFKMLFLWHISKA